MRGGAVSLCMDPRLRLDIGWMDLAVATLPRSGDARAEIAKAWPHRSAVTFLSVRTAFDALLQTLDLRAHDEIVMSGVNIESMAQVAWAHGVKLIPVDIELETLAPTPEAVEAAVTPRTRLILIAHLYGARVDLSRYASLKRPGLLLAEDCAQGWGGGYRGSPSADVSFFSFGPIKRLTALGGGVAVFADPSNAARCAALENAYAPMSEAWFLKRIAKFMALKAASTPWLYGLVVAAVQAVTGDAEKAIGAAARGFPPGDLIKRLRKRPPQRMLGLLARRLAQPENDTSRIAAAREVMGRLSPRTTLLGSAAPSHHYWLAPILVDDADTAARVLREQGFDATRGATSLRALGTDEHPTPNAQRMIEHVLYLPPPWHMASERREALARLARACGSQKIGRELELAD